MKKFNEIDETFICEHCKNEVELLKYSCRDHCNHCLYSKHVDILPGDRSNECLGILEPIGIEKFNDTFKIIYKCLKCNEIKKNIMAKDDNYDLIIELSKNDF